MDSTTQKSGVSHYCNNILEIPVLYLDALQDRLRTGGVFLMRTGWIECVYELDIWIGVYGKKEYRIIVRDIVRKHERPGCRIGITIAL
jgi:hypothetical protein